jgi:isopenicillin-N epimerase
VSQITSSTAVMLPVRQICKKASEQGLFTIVDGAHGPGHIRVDLDDLGADAYTGACHKWMMTPKGCSFLYLKKEHQQRFDPLVISWGYKSATPSHSLFLDYHQTQGTRDMSAFFTVPAAISFMKEHDWDGVSADCRKLVSLNSERFARLLKTRVLNNQEGGNTIQMQSLEVKCKQPEKLQRYLFQTYSIEIPVMKHGEKCFIRYSVNVFNSPGDIEKLYAALEEVITVTDFIQV